MKSLSIRQKLFGAFLVVLAIPLGLAAYLSIYYLRRETEVIQDDRVAKVASAFQLMAQNSDARLVAVRERVHKFAAEVAPGAHEMVDLLIHLDEESDNDPDDAQAPPALARRVQQQITQLAQSEPAIRACKILLDLPGDEMRVIVDQLNPGFDWSPRNIPKSSLNTDKPLIIHQEKIDRIVIVAHAALQLGTEDEDGALIAMPEPGKPLDPAAHVPALWVIAEIDPRALVAPVPAGVGWGFQFDTTKNELAHTPEAIALLHATRLPLEGLVTAFDPKVTSTRVKYAAQRYYVDASPVTGEHSATRLFVVMDEAAFWRPLRLRAAALILGFLTSLSLAVLLAYYLSGRFVGTLSSLSEGAEAIARGDFQAFEQRSTDEFGRLAESMNRMAEQLAQRMRKEEIDGWRRLVRVLSHEINNTLGPVRSVASTVRDQIAARLADDDAAEDLQLAFRLIIDRTDALSSFIANYAELAKLPDPVKEPTSLRTVTKSALELLADLAAQRSVKILDDLDPTLAEVPLDRAQMERVVINLVKNAIEAAPEGSTVVVRSERSVQGVELCVEDRGPGISADARRHLFVPYFTTKPGGSGLGLALVRQIVLGHGGSVVAEDLPEGGTRMRVTLPPA